MAYINPAHRGIAYGDGYMQGEGSLGQLVKIVGNDLFAVNTGASVRSCGILIKDYKAGDHAADVLSAVSTATAACMKPTCSKARSRRATF